VKGSENALLSFGFSLLTSHFSLLTFFFQAAYFQQLAG